VFLALMVAGLVGLLVMAMPALGRHAGALRGGHGLHAGAIAKLGAGAGSATHALSAATQLAKSGAPNALERVEPSAGWTRFVPTPRLIFSVLALFGAFANVFLDALELAPLLAALAAIVPTVVVERFAVTPLWRRMLQAQAPPSGPLAELVLSEAEAVTRFRNGRGIVSVVREGRRVQFAATLVESELDQPVRVGDRLRIEDVDGGRERLTVSLIGG
jgi:hypothetical protein